MVCHEKRLTSDESHFAVKAEVCVSGRSGGGGRHVEDLLSNANVFKRQRVICNKLMER